jgi:hypothetical protein
MPGKLATTVWKRSATIRLQARADISLVSLELRRAEKERSAPEQQLAGQVEVRAVFGQAVEQLGRILADVVDVGERGRVEVKQRRLLGAGNVDGRYRRDAGSRSAHGLSMELRAALEEGRTLRPVRERVRDHVGRVAEPAARERGDKDRVAAVLADLLGEER